jgi:Raf kinase inhibitor-like YbhB/YbcL family protein
MNTKPFNRALYEIFLRFSNRILRTICVIAFLGVNPASAEETMSLSIESPAFSYGGAIPARYTCKGEDISPALTWSGVPEGARSLVLIVDDPDAPDPKAPRMTWVHWVLYNIPPDATSLPEDVLPDRLPAGTKEGINDWKRTGYGGPCPPIGRHRYFHKLYALDLVLEDVKTPTKARIEAAMRGHVIAQSELVGTFEK